MSDNRKKPHPKDVHVGSRVRLRRTRVGMSQERLGENLGITFQQIQKYEKGSNRIGAGRLHDMSEVLSVPVSFFYDGLPQAGGGPAVEVREPEAPAYVADLFATTEAQQLGRAFVRITDPKVRRRIVELVRSMAAPPGEEDAPD